MYVCMYVCMYVRLHTYYWKPEVQLNYARMYLWYYLYIYICIYVRTYLCMNVFIYVCIYIFLFAIIFPFGKCKYVSLNNCIQISGCSFPEMVHVRFGLCDSWEMRWCSCYETKNVLLLWTRHTYLSMEFIFLWFVWKVVSGVPTIHPDLIIINYCVKDHKKRHFLETFPLYVPG